MKRIVFLFVSIVFLSFSYGQDLRKGKSLVIFPFSDQRYNWPFEHYTLDLGNNEKKVVSLVGDAIHCFTINEESGLKEFETYEIPVPRIDTVTQLHPVTLVSDTMIVTTYKVEQATESLILKKDRRKKKVFSLK